MISISGNLYMWVTGGKRENIFNQVRLYRSTDKGRTWKPASWNFTKSDDLMVPTILQFGKDYAGARDNFVYHYFIELQDPSPNLNIQRPGKIHLLRVDKSKIFSSKSNYQYFNGLDTKGNPIWSNSIGNKKPVFQDPNGVGWNVAVSYNPGLQRYILTTEHTKSHAGYIGIFDAPEPWGPWTTVEYDNNGNWEGFGKTFYWNFPTKWLSSDGKDFTLAFTGIEANDSWNAIKGSFTLANQSVPAPASVISSLAVASGKPYQVADDGLVSGAPFFIDRNFTFKSIPGSVDSSTYIKTANDDKSRKDTSFLSFRVNQDATVYVAYDHRASSLPNWLRSWDATGESIATTDVSFKLFAKDFAANSAVTLGGNMAAGASGAGSNYFVVVAD
jgi:hypothetical protein